MRTVCEHCTGDMFEEYKYKYPEASHCMFCGRYVGENDYHKSEPPVVKECDLSYRREEVEESHPAYAQLSIHRQSGGYNSLYGSAIKHQETICLEIHKSVKHTSGYSETYFSGGIPLISVRMSQAQFAEAITTMNMGSGTPVTLEALRGKRLPKCEEVSVSEKANNDLRDQMNDFANKISNGSKRVQEILNKKTILKGDRKEIAGIYSTLMQDLRSNLPFLHECMNEALDKSTASSKADIEAFYVNAINRMGLETMAAKTETIDFTSESNEGRGTELTSLGRNDIVDVEGE